MFLLVIALVTSACGGEGGGGADETTTIATTETVDETALQERALEVEQAIQTGFREIETAATTDEMAEAVDDLQASLVELALALDRTEAPADKTQQKQALAGMLRELDLGLADVDATVSQVPDAETARQSDALGRLAQLRHEIEVLAQDIQS